MIFASPPSRSHRLFMNEFMYDYNKKVRERIDRELEEFDENYDPMEHIPPDSAFLKRNTSEYYIQYVENLHNKK